jgi:nicotinamidase/pyrazinamidase
MQQNELIPSRGDALLAIDVQVDFLPAGALPVPEGDQVIPVLNRYLDLFAAHRLPVIASRDAHPPNHCSFREFGGPWPQHCVIGTPGAEFAAGLRLPPDHLLVSKATQPHKEAYSDFSETGLADTLRELGVRRLWTGGLATDYCVQATVLDALQLKFEVVLLLDTIRAVDVIAGDGDRAIQRMLAAGAVAARWVDSRVCVDAAEPSSTR